MATRVANLAANDRIVSLILRTQNRVHASEIRVSTGLASQDYIGIANQSERLVNMENSSTLLERYIRNNDTMELRLDTAAATLEAVKQTVTDFRKELSTYAQNTTNDAQAILNLQNTAVRSMKTMEAYLNTEADGRFLISGSRVTTESVNFNFNSLTEFQALYDGTTITYPTRRDTAIHPKLTGTTGFPSNPTGAGHTSVAFDGDQGVGLDFMDATNAGAFANIPVGAQVTISGSTGSTHDGTFTVKSNNGTRIVFTEDLAAGTPAANANVVITVNTSYYGGDERTLTHRADDDRDFTYDLSAVQPAFEKAFRAMGIIAQGGLATNAARVDQAQYLVDASLFSTVNGTPPFGAELAGNIESLSQTIGFQQILLDQTKENHATNINFLGRRISDIETVDPLESIAQLTADTRALEASYRALARVRELSLQDFLT